jgi:hypothetical protein
VTADGVWPWVLMALLGAYHGLNPAMGWLFAVGLGLQDRSRRAVLQALAPIALGHELALALVVVLVLGLGLLADPASLRVGAAGVLIAFGAFRLLRPRLHPRWVRFRVNRRELAWWSFLMSSAHGAGLMVVPVLLGAGPEGAGASDGHDHVEELGLQGASVVEGALALVLHVGAMVLVMGVVAVLVYEKLGVAFLRRSWVNTDGIWAASFVAAGLLTLVT